MKKKLSLSTVLIAVLIICGLGLILYPTLSDMYATRQYNKEIEAYNAERTRETAERNAKLFTDIDQLEVGDRFSLTILDRTLVYEVDQILVTEPTDFEPLYIVEGKDYATLYTCRPYGVNTRRLLVRGVRVDDAPAAAEKSGASWKLIVGIALLLTIITAVVYIITIIRRRKTESGQPAAAVEPEVPAAPPAETGGSTPLAPAAEAKLRPAAAAKRRAPTGYVGKHCAPSGTRKESSRSTGKQ